MKSVTGVTSPFAPVLDHRTMKTPANVAETSAALGAAKLSVSRSGHCYAGDGTNDTHWIGGGWVPDLVWTRW